MEALHVYLMHSMPLSSYLMHGEHGRLFPGWFDNLTGIRPTLLTSTFKIFSVKLRPSVRSFVRLSLSVVCVRGVHPIGERTAMLHRNLRMDKNPRSTNQYTKFGQLIFRKIIKIIASRCQILRLKCTKFYSRRLSVRPSVSPFVSNFI